ncbi:MAG: lysozyme [Glycocaulis sp.]
MKPRLKSSRAARDLIKAHEVFLGEALPRGRRWAVGYGHTAAAKQGQTLTREDAELLLLYDVMQAEAAIAAAVGDDLPGPVRDALVSFACSIGPGAFKVSDVARLARDGRHLEAAAALETWVRAEEDGRLVVSERLVRRRAAEKTLYLQGLQQPRPDPAPAPQPSAPEPAPQAAPEAETPAEAPRLGPLIDLELEFVDPPEPAGMVTAEAADDEAKDTTRDVADTAAEATAPQDEPAPEPAPAPEDAAADTPALEAEEQAPAPAEETSDPTRSVMARMAAQMSDTLAVPAPGSAGDEAPAPEAAPEPAAEPQPQPIPEPVSAGTRLGFSFLTPVTAEVKPVAPAPAAPRSLISSGPVPVYGGVVAGQPVQRPEPAEPAPAPVIDPLRAESPAPAAGFSGEVQAVGRPDDIDEEEEDAAAADELHPGVLTGSAPEPVAAPPVMAPAPAARAQGSGNWVFLANLAAGIVLTGLGIWDILAQDANGQASEFGWFGPVAAAMGVVLVISSGWMLIARRKPAASEPSWDEEDQA